MFDIILTLAMQEAIVAGYSEITPAHLLIALSRLSEADESAIAPADSAVIRREFENFGLEPRRFRRRLRALLGHRGVQPQGEAMHRSLACRAVFSWAERIAMAEHVPCDASHLVRAALLVLSEGHSSDGGEQATEGITAPANDIPTEL